MMVYVLVRTPDDGAHLYRLGEYADTSDPVAVAKLDGIRAAHKIPDGWVDMDGWSLQIGGPLDPDAVGRLDATTHDLTTE